MDGTHHLPNPQLICYTLFMHTSLLRISVLLLGLLCLSSLVLAGLFYYQKDELEKRFREIMSQAEEREAEFLAYIDELEIRYHHVSTELLGAQGIQDKLTQSLEQEQERVEEIEENFNRIEREYDRINDTVSDLVKLQNTDEELLQKYSRVYFLNENYVPQNLVAIPSEYTWGNQTLYIHSQVWPFLEKLLERAQRDELDLRILSAYRSFETQSELKQRYLAVYGSGANQFSADQGYSEHQLGSTIDFTTPTNGSDLSLFKNTEAYAWLGRYAYRYGFTLSYPEGNSFYQFEPWHWRFVGRDLADELHDEGAFFYDLDQREIDEYLLEIFD